MSTYSTASSDKIDKLAEDVKGFTRKKSEMDTNSRILKMRDTSKINADDHHVNPQYPGIDPDHAADLRMRLSCFAEDWDRPEMDAYDHL